MPNQYYLNRNDKVRGPFSEERLRELHAEGKLREADFVSTRNDGGWEPVANVLKAKRPQSASTRKSSPDKTARANGRRAAWYAGGSIGVIILATSGWFFFGGGDNANPQGVTTSDSSTKSMNLPASRPDVTFQDFESDSFGDWVVTGTAFGTKPYAPEQNQVPMNSLLTPINGRHVADSYFAANLAGSHELTGSLVSPPFKIERNYINFCVACGEPDAAQVVLRIDGKIQRKAGEQGHPKILRPMAWGVSEFIGKTATIEVLDESKKQFGHVCVDSFVFSDSDLTTANLERIAASVQSDAVEWNAGRYYIGKQKVPFREASQFASQVGGQLLCTESPEEIAFINQHTSESVWLGIENRNGAGVWYGPEDRVYSHGPWRDGEPEYYHSRNAVVNLNGRWQDRSASTPTSFVVEFGPVHSPPTLTIGAPTANRKAAELIQRKGSAVGVATAAGYHWLTATTPLPKDDFELRDVRFVKGTKLTPEEIDTFRGVIGVTRLDVDQCDDSVLEILQYTPKIRWIGVSGGTYQWTGLQHLKLGHVLRRCDLGSVRISANQLRPVFSGAALEEFRMTGMAANPDFADLFLQQRNSLKYLWLNAVGGLGTEGINKLGELHELQDLVIWGTGTTDENLPSIGRLTGLKSIQLGANRGISGKLLEALEPLHKLESLSLWATGLDDSGLEKLPPMPSLTSITVGSTKITDASLGRIAELPKIREVSVDGTEVTSLGLEKLKTKPSITRIICAGSKITMEAINEFARSRPGFSTDLTTENSGVIADESKSEQPNDATVNQFRQRIQDVDNLLSHEPELKIFVEGIEDASHRDNLKSAIYLAVVSGEFGAALLNPKIQLLVGRVVAEDQILADLIATTGSQPAIVLKGGYFIGVNGEGDEISATFLHPEMKPLKLLPEKPSTSRICFCGAHTMTKATEVDLVTIKLQLIGKDLDKMTTKFGVRLETDRVRSAQCA